MKKILSVSVGSSQRDHTTHHTFLGQECEISRQGTDGDFEKAIQDPGNPARMAPAYDSGDKLHPGDAGYKRMAESIDLTLFE